MEHTIVNIILFIYTVFNTKKIKVSIDVGVGKPVIQCFTVLT